MPPLSGPLAFHTVAQSLVDAVLARLVIEAETGAPAPTTACVVPGSIAWDSCACGQLAVSVTRTYPSASFPNEATGVDLASGGPCGAPLLLADLLVQVVRCAPSPDAQGRGPSCAELDASAQAVLADAYHARMGAFCKLKDMEDTGEITDYLVRGQTWIGPSGGCTGSELVVTVAVKAQCC